MEAHTPRPLVVESRDDVIVPGMPFALVDANGRVTAYVLREADAYLYAHAARLLALVRTAFLAEAEPGDVASRLERLIEEAHAIVDEIRRGPDA